MRILCEEIVKHLDEEVELAGWVDARRDHGKIIFIDLRDASGTVQIVFTPKNKELYDEANRLRPEWVVRVAGKVKERPAGMQNPELKTGKCEIEASHLDIQNEAKTPPLSVNDSGYEIGEETRMKYRYLDLRRPRLQKNIRLRSVAINFMRNYLTEKGFTEIETPYLGKSTPEGARDYLVPSRLEAGKFYALAQSPQQYKQLLMVAGMEKYFQIARCFRDEDTRGDRQPEFTQLDIELSFTEESEIINLISGLVIELVKKLFPDKKIQDGIPPISYDEAMQKYGTDKPDLHKNGDELAFLWIIHFPLFEYSETEKKLVSMHHPFTAPEDDSIALLESHPEKAKARAYDLVLNGYEVGGGSMRIHKRELQEKVFRVLGLSPETYTERFGHLLEAFEYGAPPHGGIAIGLDRLIAVLLNEPNIREVIAFPKTGDGRDLMMDAPSEVDKRQLDELHLQIKKSKK
ncbi:MAG: aspartate--tRNA ligase [Parcubacteria group bacterium]|nr:aspartate--tRNA ligase [Parcubacteria group bacterium]